MILHRQFFGCCTYLQIYYQVLPQVLRRREVRAQGGERDIVLRIIRDIKQRNTGRYPANGHVSEENDDEKLGYPIFSLDIIF